MLHSGDEGPWKPKVLAVSAVTGTGMRELWDAIHEHDDVLRDHGLLAGRRREQRREWLWQLLREGLERRFRDDPEVREALAEAERAVVEGDETPAAAAGRLLDLFKVLRS